MPANRLAAISWPASNNSRTVIDERRDPEKITRWSSCGDGTGAFERERRSATAMRGGRSAAMTVTNGDSRSDRDCRQHLAAGLAALLLVAHAITPPFWGDVYPFTTGPMFRDSPRECCNYRVFDLDGTELSPRDWQVQRIYDGNPPGYGVGVRPPPVLERTFGVVHAQELVRQHFMAQLQRPEHRDRSGVVVVQQLIGPADSRRIGEVKENQWKIPR